MSAQQKLEKIKTLNPDSFVVTTGLSPIRLETARDLVSFLEYAREKDEEEGNGHASSFAEDIVFLGADDPSHELCNRTAEEYLIEARKNAKKMRDYHLALLNGHEPGDTVWYAFAKSRSWSKSRAWSKETVAELRTYFSDVVRHLLDDPITPEHVIDISSDLEFMYAIDAEGGYIITFLPPADTDERQRKDKE